MKRIVGIRNAEKALENLETNRDEDLNPRQTQARLADGFIVYKNGMF